MQLDHDMTHVRWDEQLCFDFWFIGFCDEWDVKLCKPESICYPFEFELLFEFSASTIETITFTTET